MARGKTHHFWIHTGLISFTLLTIYPVLWVLALAFSGQQSVGLIDLPKDPSFLERARGILPWPAHFSVKNFVDVMTEQPFGRWLLNSGRRCSACSWPAPRPTPSAASASPGATAACSPSWCRRCSRAR